MKYIKKFSESDSWAGSLLAYDKRIKPVEDKVLPKLIRYSFKCNDCENEFDSFNPQEEYCRCCESTNIEPLGTNDED